MSGTSDNEVKQRVLKAAKGLDMLSAMSMNRAERRRIAKMNNMPRILGSVKPFVKEKGV